MVVRGWVAEFRPVRVSQEEAVGGGGCIVPAGRTTQLLAYCLHEQADLKMQNESIFIFFCS